MAARRYFDDEPDLSPFLKALHDVRQQATRKGGATRTCKQSSWRSTSNAEAATGKPGVFPYKPHGLG